MSPAVLGRILVILGACGASSGLVACSWLLNWNAYTDGGAGLLEPSADETGGGSSDGLPDASAPEDVDMWIYADGSQASGDADAAGVADASTATDGADAANGARDATNEGPAACSNCRGCCDSTGMCKTGYYPPACGNGGAQCEVCTASKPYCLNGACSSSQSTGPSCTSTNVSTCGNRCIPVYQLTCCKADNTCGCTFNLFPPPPCQ